MSDYTGEQITRDAVAFAESRFGKHYLRRLKSARQRALEEAEDLTFTDSYRANRASQAAAVRAEIDYFATAKKIKNDPKLMRKLIEAARNRKQKEEPDIDL